MEIRSRVIAFVKEGNGHREAARHFRVSPRFVNDMVILKRTSGGLLPKKQGNHAVGKLAPFDNWLRERLAVKGDLTLDEIVAELLAIHGLTVHRGSVGKWLNRLGLSHKKTLLASEQLRPDVAERRRNWVEFRQPDMANRLEMLVFIDETSLKTNLVKTTGWAPVGARLIDHAPFGHWHTQTFIAGLGAAGLIAPWVLDGAMNRASFEAYVAHELAPALKPGQIVIADNLSSHKSPRAQALLRAQGNDLPAALLPRPQPHRDGILETENPHPKSRRQNLPSPVEQGRTSLQPLPPKRVPQLLQCRRIWNNLKATRSSILERVALLFSATST